MASCNTVAYTNIKNLPHIYNIENGDYLIVETQQGTQIIDFKDFIIPLENTTFGALISTFATDITALSTLGLNYLPLSGGTLTGNLQLQTGARLDFGNVTLSDTISSENTDPVYIERINAANDNTELRVVFTDNSGSTVDYLDTFTIGSYHYRPTNTTGYTPLFSLSSDGNAELKGSLKSKSTASAWVNFDGMAKVNNQGEYIRSSHNIASVDRVFTNTLTGFYVNFETPMKDSNYCVIASGMQGNDDSGGYGDIVNGRPDSKNRCFIQTWNTFSSAQKQLKHINVAIFEL